MEEIFQINKKGYRRIKLVSERLGKNGRSKVTNIEYNIVANFIYYALVQEYFLLIHNTTVL